MAARRLIIAALLALVCASCRSGTSSVDENRIDLVADDRVFEEAAPGTTEEIVSVRPAEEQLGGQLTEGEVLIVHTGTADLAAARWWFARLEQTGWTVNEIGGVDCRRGSYALFAKKMFDMDEGSFPADVLVAVEGGEVRVRARVTAAKVETPGSGNVGDAVDLADTCLGAD